MPDPETIPTTFDPATLPAWTRVHGNDIVIGRLAARDLGYRGEVFTATTAQVQHALTIRAFEANDRAQEAHQPEGDAAVILRMLGGK